MKAENMIRTVANEVLLEEVGRQLADGKSVKLRANGNSMWPFIYGDRDILVIAPAKKLRKWDVVLAKVDLNRYMAHRIVKIENERIMLMGDGNLIQREECSRADIFGRVKSIIRNGQERSLISNSSRLCAFGWHLLLPVRRFMGGRFSTAIMRIRNYM